MGTGLMIPAKAAGRSLDEFVGILGIAAVITLLLAPLIAFNTASIGMDERTREHATTLAFGLPIRGVLAIITVETALLGVLGTVAGIGGGYAIRQIRHTSGDECNCFTQMAGLGPDPSANTRTEGPAPAMPR